MLHKEAGHHPSYVHGLLVRQRVPEAIARHNDESIPWQQPPPCHIRLARHQPVHTRRLLHMCFLCPNLSAGQPRVHMSAQPFCMRLDACSVQLYLHIIAWFHGMFDQGLALQLTIMIGSCGDRH